MKENKINNIEQLESKIQSVGIDLTIIESLINVLNKCISEDSDVNRIDTENLVIILKRMICSIINKYDKIEAILDL